MKASKSFQNWLSGQYYDTARFLLTVNDNTKYDLAVSTTQLRFDLAVSIKLLSFDSAVSMTLPSSDSAVSTVHISST